MIDAPSINDNQLLAQIAAILDGLGPFRAEARRSDRWRTTEQLAAELQMDSKADFDRVDRVLRGHEVDYVTRLEGGSLPEAVVRRAKYPDRTTALPLWGSVRWHGQPWMGHQKRELPDAQPASLGIPLGAPTIFLSHTSHDRLLAYALAEAMAGHGIQAWRFESGIGFGSDIADAVRAALAEADAIVVLLTGYSIASLWVLTELHTGLEVNQRIAVVLHTDNPLLTDLVESTRFPHPDGEFDTSVEYSAATVRLLRDHFRRTETEARVNRYERQAVDFLATLPSYLRSWDQQPGSGWMPLYAFPYVPQVWNGAMRLDPLAELAAAVNSHTAHSGSE